MLFTLSLCSFNGVRTAFRNQDQSENRKRQICSIRQAKDRRLVTAEMGLTLMGEKTLAYLSPNWLYLMETPVFQDVCRSTRLEKHHGVYI